MSASRILVYLLRRDLRLGDNPVFHEVARAFQQSQHPYTHLLPLYIFPAQQVEVSGFLSSPSDKSPYPEARSNAAGFWRCGPSRAKFLAESVWDLKKGLENVGSGLEIRVGMLGQILKHTLEELKKTDANVVGVWMTEEEGVEEKREERDVRRVAEAMDIEFKLWTDEKYFVDEWVHSLVGVEDTDVDPAAMCPFRIHVTCQTFSLITRRRWSHCERLLGERFLISQGFLLCQQRSVPSQALFQSLHPLTGMFQSIIPKILHCFIRFFVDVIRKVALRCREYVHFLSSVYPIDNYIRPISPYILYLPCLPPIFANDGIEGMI